MISEFTDGAAVLKNRNLAAMQSELIEWIKQGLAKPGKRKSGLAEALGRSPSTVTDILNGNRAVKVDEIPRVAAYLDLAPPALPGLDLRNPAEIMLADEGRLRLVTVAGEVQAGSFRPIDEFDQSEPVTFLEPADPDFPKARRMAFDVVGNSMDRLAPIAIPPGSRVICVDFDDIGIPLRERMVLVVQQEMDGGQLRELSLKQLEIHDDRYEFHPRSSNSRHKPIVVARDLQAEDGREVRVIGLVREIKSRLPLF